MVGGAILALMYTLIPFLTFTLANAASTGVSAGDIAVNLNDLITLHRCARLRRRSCDWHGHRETSEEKAEKKE